MDRKHSRTRSVVLISGVAKESIQELSSPDEAAAAKRQALAIHSSGLFKEVVQVHVVDLTDTAAAVAIRTYGW